LKSRLLEARSLKFLKQRLCRARFFAKGRKQAVADLAVRRRACMLQQGRLIANVRQKIADLASDPAVEEGAAMA
jgi:hypothetical protein